MSVGRPLEDPYGEPGETLHHLNTVILNHISKHYPLPYALSCFIKAGV